MVTLLISASAGCSLFLLGMYLYQRYGLPATFESLRGGRWHFFVLGAATVLIMSHQCFPLHSYTPALKGLLGIGLTWIGFRAGLDFDFRQLQQANPGQVRQNALNELNVRYTLFRSTLWMGARTAGKSRKRSFSESKFRLVLSEVYGP